jgi:hypothetical protein
MSTTPISYDATLLTRFVNQAHDQTVGGAVRSEDTGDDMEISNALADKSASDMPDDPSACMPLGNPYAGITTINITSL